MAKKRALKMRTVTTGVMGESARWHEDRLWFSDWGGQEIVAMDLDGKREVIMDAPSFPFCFDWLPDGRMIIVSGRTGQLLRREPDGALTPYAELGGLSKNSWKDIAVDGRGNAFVGNVGFDFPDEDFAPGLLAVVTPDGKARTVAQDIAFPHGIVVTPDDATLIVAEAYGGVLTAFDIADDGGLSNRRVWADLRHGVPHGICLDAQGAVWYSDLPAERCVRVAENGKVLQAIDTDGNCFACALGGTDNDTLFMMTAYWDGEESMREGAETGQVFAATVEVGRPDRG